MATSGRYSHNEWTSKGNVSEYAHMHVDEGQGFCSNGWYDITLWYHHATEFQRKWKNNYEKLDYADTMKWAASNLIFPFNPINLHHTELSFGGRQNGK